MSAQDWVIRATTGPEYWSNAGGWVSRADADVFTAQDVETLRLPLGGAWELADAGPKARLSYRVKVEVEVWNTVNDEPLGSEEVGITSRTFAEEGDAQLLAQQLVAIGEALIAVAEKERALDEQVRAESRDDAADRAKELDSERDQRPGEYLIEVAQRSKEACVDCGTTVAMTPDWTLLKCSLCETECRWGAEALRCTACYEKHWQASHSDD